MATGGADDAKTEVHKDATTMTQLEEDAKVNMSKFKLLPHVDGENGPVVSTPNFDARFNFNPTGPNESYLHGMPATYSIPKLPTFSGNESSQKGEVTYDVWSFEVRCLKRTGQYPEHIILQALRNSLKGTARSMSVSLGEGASVNDVLTKLDGFYGTVSTCEISIMIIRRKTSLFKKDFQSLLMEIRKVEQEETNKVHMVQKVSSKVARQQPSQVDTQRDSNKEVLDQLTKLMSRLESLEQKVNTNIAPPHTGDSRPTYRGRGQTYNRYSNRGNRTPFRGRASGRGNAPNFRYNGSQSSN
ncbi:hypothetical protein FSP39_019291 [Pinctada imbricata]|uniref:Uncharacterized protein n=1 Tax=Pinctada imbricata TaxID=66713 RepID=A0AA88YNY1_PINIB|nr:hypothetical protein FSP39_019291 [Pinctada imbricata]